MSEETKRKPRKKTDSSVRDDEDGHKKRTMSALEIINKIDESEDDMFASQEASQNSQKEALSNSATITFHDMPPLQEKLLDIIYHKQQYPLPLNLYDKKYIKKPLKERIANLYTYFVRLDAKIGALAKRSLVSAPKPKEICSSTKFSGTLFKGDTSQIFNDDSQSLTDFYNRSDENSLDFVYTSRAGRQIKRKIYAEDVEDEVSKSKKAKDADTDEWKVKRAKNSDGGVKKPTENATALISDFSKMTNRKIKQDVKKTPLLSLSERNTLLQSYSASPLSTKKTPKTRSESLFDIVRDDCSKRLEEERVLEMFQQKVDAEILDDDEIHPQIEIVEGKRVVPPSGRKKNLPSTSSGSKAEGDTRRSPRKLKTIDPITDLKSNKKPVTLRKPLSSDLNEITQIIEEDANNICCPICSKFFPQTEIENHASNCGETGDDVVETRSRARGEQSNMTCEICDMVFPISTDYEVHVRDCIQNRK